MTQLQIFQFVITNTSSYFWLYTYYWGEKPCRGTVFGFWFGQFILWSFLFLFVKFYIENILANKAKRAEEASKKTQSEANKKKTQ